MKILFTADWHIKLGQKNVPLDWAKNRYSLFFQQLKEIESNVDLHIIGGDIFDRLPSMEELQLYFIFISQVRIKTLIYAGNHEATKKGKTFFSYLKDATYRINPLVEVVDYIYESNHFTIVPYEFIKVKGVWESLDKSIPVYTHVRGEIPPHVQPEIDLDLLKDFPVVYAGDLHSHTNRQRNIIYPGSPMTTEFHRKPLNTGYLLIEGCNWEWRTFDPPLPQLIRKTVSDPALMIATEYDHTIYELEGDIVDLANIENSELLDKKLIKRSNESALILTKDMTREDELAEYLTYVLEIPEGKISDIMGVYNDYAAKISLG